MTSLILPAVRGDLAPCVLARSAVQRADSEGSLGRGLHEGSSPAPTTSAAKGRHGSAIRPIAKPYEDAS